MIWALWILAGWVVLACFAYTGARLVEVLRSYLQACHRPHRDANWQSEAVWYQVFDTGRRTLLTRLLWRFARWAPFGAKMIWRDGDPYMARVYLTPWWFPRQLYLHRILRSDDALHSHPWAWACSVLLEGSYLEERSPLGNAWVTYARKRWVNRIPPGVFHAIYLDRGPVWTLFFTGPRDREWGFLQEDGTYLSAGEVQRIATRRAGREVNTSNREASGIVPRRMEP